MLTLKEGNANERCIKLIPDIRKAHEFYFGLNFPYHYSVAQAEVESNCIHNIFSNDGVGSEGFAQITFVIWKEKLKNENINDIYSIKNYARAQAYINYLQYKQSYCKKLFEMYQRYNGGSYVTKELILSNSCNWSDAYKVCKRGNVCVWKVNNICKQYKNACDINYNYSLTIYKKSINYKLISDERGYAYW
ncbi:MAG: hypothetical protein ACP5PT_00835 [Brevinematia bacterium]